MKFSEKLNGFWEEGYHYYLEFRNDKLTVRNYMRAIALKTDVSYDAEALERGERTVITLADNVLSRDYEGNPFTMIRELAYENGELKFLYYYTIMGETLYTLKKVDHGPFAHIIIRDDEFMDRLQGEWVEWSKTGTHTGVMTIKGNTVKAFSFSEPEPFHVVSYTYAPDKVVMVPENLIDGNFRGYTEIEVLPDMLTTRMMVFDASVPLTVFARRDMLDKIKVPDAAFAPMRNTMTRMPDDGPMMFFGMPGDDGPKSFFGIPGGGMFGGGLFTGGDMGGGDMGGGDMGGGPSGGSSGKTPGTGKKDGDPDEPGKPEEEELVSKTPGGRICPQCHADLGLFNGKFCYECGARL